MAPVGTTTSRDAHEIAGNYSQRWSFPHPSPHRNLSAAGLYFHAPQHREPSQSHSIMPEAKGILSVDEERQASGPRERLAMMMPCRRS